MALTQSAPSRAHRFCHAQDPQLCLPAFSVAFSLGWLMTGDWRVGGALALLEPLCNTVLFHFHEKFWEARRQGARAPRITPRPCRGGRRLHA